ncbi:manganese/zinc/iron transport system permease protein [Spirochaetota bacterium]|nr:manganese/zinc/iron transport system permease protein [Spirochaetota bacterium]
MNLVIDYTTGLVVLGNLAFACTAGMLSPFVTLRRESFLGDGTAHAALAGIFFILIFPSLATTLTLLIGGLSAALLAHFILFFLQQETKLNKDMILAITLSLFIALALVLFTALIGHLEKLATLTTLTSATERSSTLIRHYIFGSPASLTQTEALLLITVALSATIMMLCFYKVWKLFTFDATWAQTLGFSFTTSEFLFKALFITTVMTGLFSVGALMVSALFVAPSIAARVFTTRLKPLIALSITINFTTTSLALFLGSKFTGIPEGPTIVFLTSLLAIILPLIAYSYHRYRHLLGPRFKKYH